MPPPGPGVIASDFGCFAASAAAASDPRVVRRVVTEPIGPGALRFLECDVEVEAIDGGGLLR